MAANMVSIIVPVYNAEKYLDKCIESLVTQTYENIEIIMVDDCSTDGSFAKCRTWQKNDDRIKVYSLENNSGPSVARNKGMKEAKGEYITFADADDWMEKECVEKALSCAIQSDADVVFWNLANHFGKEVKTECILEGNERILVGDEIKLLCRLLLYMKAENGSYALGLIGPFCKLLRASILDGISFPEQINSGEDTCFNLQVFSTVNKVLYINQVYYNRLFLTDSLSNKADINYAERGLLCTNWILNYCKTKNILPDKELNEYVYTALKTVVVHYTKNPFPYRKVARKKINYFIDNLDMRIDWNNISKEDGLKLLMLKMRCYWIYKVFFWIKK